MPLLKQIPLFSLTLLLITNTAFGLLLPAVNSFWNWFLPIVLILLIALTLTVPLKNFTRCLASLLKSDLRAFITVILAAFAVVVIMRWIVTASRVLTLLAAGALARLDMQTRGYTQQQAFLTIAIVSLVGLSLGVILHLTIFIKIL